MELNNGEWSGMKTRIHEWRGLMVEYYVVRHGFEGDSSIPRGTRKVGNEIGEIEIFAPDGSRITEFLTQKAYDEIIEEIEAVGGDE